MQTIEAVPENFSEVSSDQPSPRQQLLELTSSVRQARGLDPSKDYLQVKVASYDVKDKTERLGAYVDHKVELQKLHEELDIWRKDLAKVGTLPEGDQVAQNVETAFARASGALQFPGHVLASAENTTKVAAVTGASFAGVELAKAAALSASGTLPAWVGAIAPVPGALAGIAAPLLISKIADKIPNSKIRSAAKVAMNAALFAGAAYLAPAALPAMLVSTAIGAGLHAMARLARPS